MDDLATQTKLALRRLAKSVAIVTTRWNGVRYAMAATAVEGLTLDPPSLLLCINKTASLAAPLTAGAPFTVNLLAHSHADLSARCGAPWQGEERFALGAWNDAGPAPILEDAQASFVCTPDLTTSYGTHIIVVGKIQSVALHGDVTPLVYVDGSYRGVAQAA